MITKTKGQSWQSNIASHIEGLNPSLREVNEGMLSVSVDVGFRSAVTAYIDLDDGSVNVMFEAWTADLGISEEKEFRCWELDEFDSEAVATEMRLAVSGFAG